MILSKEKVPVIGDRRTTKVFAIFPLEINERIDGVDHTVLVWLEFVHCIEEYTRNYLHCSSDWKIIRYERI